MNRVKTDTRLLSEEEVREQIRGIIRDIHSDSIAIGAGLTIDTGKMHASSEDDIFDLINSQISVAQANQDPKRVAIERYITDNYGERCKITDNRCPTCQEWEIYDQWLASLNNQDKEVTHHD